MKIWGILALVLVCSLCISTAPQKTEPPTTPPVTELPNEAPEISGFAVKKYDENIDGFG
ncbi:MAG: hypothetical protein KAV80_03540 [Methanomicrobia archaeon]|nr:hypothetical protein [Methanomicrobia archaeon]